MNYLLTQFLANNKTIQDYMNYIQAQGKSILKEEYGEFGKIIKHSLIFTEKNFIWSLIHAFKLANEHGYKKPRYSYFSVHAKTAKLILKEFPELNNLETLQKINTSLHQIYLIEKAKSSFDLDKKEKTMNLLSLQKAMTLMQQKNASLVYCSGVNVITTKRDFGGVVRGVVTEEMVDLLLKENKISRVPYFNHKGRKLYELNKGQKYAIPAWMKKSLPQSYLTACGA